jgi:hypothetical protein
MIMVSGNWIRGGVGVGLQLLESPPRSKEPEGSTREGCRQTSSNPFDSLLEIVGREVGDGWFSGIIFFFKKREGSMTLQYHWLRRGEPHPRFDRDPKNGASWF